ncbi:conserved domain protein [Yersinia pseudotuberculosis IP 31758]|uniref:Conserved domain protein n=1 Tax=Yersinia pseudotuberculosis serotype O:1b (strain IP 31758) TaxID=349747 RepID=A0A0U1QZX2_YERP3|nr:conserved domain protein [Yersinia pseudotuberculosis IP 31758]
MAPGSLYKARLLTNPNDAILNGEDKQKSKVSAPWLGLLTNMLAGWLE